MKGKNSFSALEMVDLIQYEELSGDGYYDFLCKKGHRNIIVSQEPTFELLFQSGVALLSQKHYREAVFDFASALERFMEFCLKALLFSEQLPFDMFDKTWKGISNQTERQLGAFYFVYLMSMKEPPLIITDKKFNISSKKDMANFRNAVIHKGDFPSKEESWKYGRNVYDYIVLVLTALNDRLGDKWQTGLTQAVFHHLNDVRTRLKNNLGDDLNDAIVRQQSMPTFVSVSRPIPEISFQQVMEEYISATPRFVK